MYPTNEGVSAETASALLAIPVAAERIMPDCHVGGGGGIGCAEADFNRLPDFHQSFINCETNAAISDMNRAIMEAADLMQWFNTTDVDGRLRGRTASFCTERSGHYDAFDQGISFFLPNASWIQPPGYVHAMISRTWADGNALQLSLSGGDWLSASSQLTDDKTRLVVHLVNSVDSMGPGVATLSFEAFQPSGVINVWTLQVPTADGVAPDKLAGNTPSDPTFISPKLSNVWWPQGAAALNVTLPAFSYTVLELFAQ
jgi:hypothetical protein